MKTVQELLDELSSMPRGAFVLMASDSEGNNYRKIDEVEGGYLSEDQGFNEIELLVPEETDIYDEEMNEGLTETVVIWPM